MTAIGTFSWPPFQVQKGTLKEVLWGERQLGEERLHRAQIPALLKMRSKAIPITQLLIFDISGGVPPPNKNPLQRGTWILGVHWRAKQEVLWGCSCSPFTDLAAICYEKEIWAEMIKKWVHPWQKILVPAVPQSSCRLRIAGWSGLSSCRLPCFLSLHLREATRNISSSLLRQFPCTQEGRTSAFMLSLQDLLMAVRGSRGLGPGL